MSTRGSFVLWRAIAILCGAFPGLLFSQPQAEAATADNSIWVSEPYVITAPDDRVLHPIDLNDLGQVIGVDESYLRSFVWSRQTGFKDLGAVAVSSINNCGEIAGTVGTDNNRRAVRIYNGLIEELGTLEPDNPDAWSMGAGINERGDVVGAASRGETEMVAFLWTEERGMVPLTGPATDGVFFSGANDINNRRQIAGGKQNEPFNGLSVAAMWHETELQWTGGLGGRFFHAYAINAFGEIIAAGSTGNYYGPLRSSIYWSSRKGLIELSPPGGPVDYWLEIGADAYDIDDRGRIAGAVNESTEIYNWKLQAAIWTAPDRYHLLSDRPSLAVAINNRGQVLGSINGDDTSPGMPTVLWQIHTPIDKSLLNAAYATLGGLAICKRRGL